MDAKLIKNLSIASAVLANSLITAGMDVDTRISQLESQMKEVRTITENQTYGAKTATGVPQLQDGRGCFLGIGATYQTIILSQSDFAFSASEWDDANEEIVTPAKGRLLEAKNNYAWGINAQLGYNFEHDNIYGAITNRYFKSSFNSKASVKDPAGIIPTRISQETTTGADYAAYEASSNWTAYYDLLGIEIGRDFYVSRYLSIKPMFGLLLNFISLEDRISYSGLEYAEDSEYVKDKLDSFGFGPQTGFVLDIGLQQKEGFSIFSDTRVALMYSNFDIQHSDVISGDENSDFTIKTNPHRVLPYVDSILGLSYEKTTQNKKNHFKIRAGYEIQYFFGLNQMIYPVDINTGNEFKLQEGNMETSGLLIDFTWTF